MGAPKQKWTPEEEAALKAGVVKHGAGKWRTILKDPEFSRVLYLRSNVDLKDKWRNMSVMANGWTSRDKSRLAIRRVQPFPRRDVNSMALTPFVPSDEEDEDFRPQVSRDIVQIPGPNRLDSRIMEAITSLGEAGGSNKTAIAAYIEDQYWAPSDFKRLLSAKLKYLTESGKLIKAKRKYRIAPTPVYSDRRRNQSVLLNERQRFSMKFDKDEINILTKSQIDLEVEKMRSMTAQEASAVAARAVAEAEAAMTEAEEAAREAEAAEADAEAAQAFADAAMKTMKGRNTSTKNHPHIELLNNQIMKMLVFWPSQLEPTELNWFSRKTEANNGRDKQLWSMCCSESALKIRARAFGLVVCKVKREAYNQ
ncbi:telomere repeat-binding factor 1 isoform X1 [Senna tora]|uniref:MYB transcription factor n=1 Tax=Senna tora TaxID=362788 RepID=A0A834SV56_9FABA|nr:telomere repeat-binding factor 1 isoform X1 [Senna tora]